MNGKLMTVSDNAEGRLSFLRFSSHKLQVTMQYIKVHKTVLIFTIIIATRFNT